MFGRVLNIPEFLYAMVIQGSESPTYSHGHKIMKHFRILVWFHSSQVVYEIAHEIQYKKTVNCTRAVRRVFERLKTQDLNKSRNYGKISKLVEEESSTQSSIQKKIFGTSSLKLRKNKYQSFSSCPFLLHFLILFH